jgi:prepilin-type N-terminal cleavage/methylation domain-containing protein
VQQRHHFANGFTLLELLASVAIIAVLAALLVPVLTDAKRRARQASCVAQLREAGLAFHLFAHDHGNRFPMTVPAAEGGSAEWVRTVLATNGSFSSPHPIFRTLSEDLKDARVLRCPADETRFPVRDARFLRNENLSYFVGVQARYGDATSLLAGDANLDLTESVPTPGHTFGRGQALRWNGAGHRFRGNLVAGDGHVEMKRSAWVRLRDTDLAEETRLMLPTLAGTGSREASGRNVDRQFMAALDPKKPEMNQDPTNRTEPFTNWLSAPGPDAASAIIQARQVDGGWIAAPAPGVGGRVEAPKAARAVSHLSPPRQDSPADGITAPPGTGGSPANPFESLRDWMRDVFLWVYLALLLLALAAVGTRVVNWLKHRTPGSRRW